MFDNIIDRRKTNSAKWEESLGEVQSEELISLSVADMDLQTAPAIVDKMVEAAKHGIYGYTNESEGYYQAVQHWMQKSYDWNIPLDWIVFCPRIIQAISIMIRNFSNSEDKILIQTPLYSPLKKAIELNNRTILTNPLVYKNKTYEIDFADLEEKFSKGVKIMILCSPHNPIGRVWNVAELNKIADLCIRYQVLLISDEVHADFTFSKTHLPAGKIQGMKDNVIICTSPSKTFNIPGLEVSNIIIPNKKLRDKFKLNLQQVGIFNPTYFGVPALEQAYYHSDDWLTKVKNYISDNYYFVKSYLHFNLPELQIVQSEGTYLMWIDCRNLGLNENDLKKWFFSDSKVAVSMGSSFGSEGEGFIRLNLATPKKQLEKALDRIVKTCPLNLKG